MLTARGYVLPLATAVAAVTVLAGGLAPSKARAALSPGTVTTLAGSAGEGAATSLRLFTEGLAVRDGQLLLPSSGLLRQVDLASGQARIVLGDGTTSAHDRVSDKPIRNAKRAAVDPAGNVYLTEAGVPGRVIRVAPDRSVTVLAGDGIARSGGDNDEDWGDGGTGVEVPMSYAQGIALAADGSVYVSQPNYHRVRRIAPSGEVSTVAGTGTPGFSGDGGPATAAQLTWPRGLAVDTAGSLYIADSSNQRVRRVAPDGTISTVAGSSSAPDTGPSSSCEGQHAGLAGGFSGDGGPAQGAALRCPAGVAVTPDGSLYIADLGNHRLRKVTADGTISTVAGNGQEGYGADRGRAVDLPLWVPADVAVDGGAVFVTDANIRVRRIDPDGSMTTVAGRVTPAEEIPDGTRATAAPLGYVDAPVTGPDGTYFADRRHVRRIDSSGALTTVAGRGLHPGGTAPSPDGLPAREGYLDDVRGLDVDRAGTLYLADSTRVLTVDRESGRFRSLVGDGTRPPPDDGPAAGVALFPTAITVTPDGTPYVAQDAQVWRLDADGTMHRVAGARGGDPQFADDGGSARDTPLHEISDLDVSPEGDLLVATTTAVWRVDGDGRAHHVAGRLGDRFAAPGTYDEDLAREARLSVRAVTGGQSGELYLSDGHRVRRVTPDGVISTIAGSPLEGFGGDGGPALEARFFDPRGLSVTPAGDLLVADGGNARVRVVRDVALAPSRTEPVERPALTVSVEPSSVDWRTEPIDPRDADRPAPHPGVVKVVVAASSSEGLRELRIDDQLVGGTPSSRAASRDVLELYAAQPGAHHVTLTAVDTRGATSSSTVSFSVATTAEATAAACSGAPEDGAADVPESDVHEVSVDCVAWWGIARGVEGGGYAPAKQVSRAQMASFLARTLTAAGAELDSSRDAFADDDGSTHESSIDALAEAGILGGTGPRTFSPDRPVSRGQVATMIARSYAFLTGETLAASSSYFADDSFDVHQERIDQAAQAALVTGTAGARYSPTRAVTRAQMATVLARALSRLVDRGLATPPGG